MKQTKLVFILALVFLVACSVDVSVLNQTNQTQPVLPEITINITESQQVEENVTQEIPNDKIIKKVIEGKEHTIEVIDVDESGKSCLIRVDGFTDLIDEGETKTINGVLIYVSEVRVMRSATADEDICQMIIG